jgi:hypothetical protein
VSKPASPTGQRQKLLALQRGQRIAAIEGIDAERLDPKVTAKQLANVIDLLVQVECCGSNKGSFARNEVLGGRMRRGRRDGKVVVREGLSARTARRTAQLASQLGLLRIEARPGFSNRYVINWDRIFAMTKTDIAAVGPSEHDDPTPLDAKPRSTSVRSGHSQDGHTPGQFGHPPGQNGHTPGQIVPPYSSSLVNNSSPPPPGADGARDDATGWGRVVQELEAEGVGCAGDAAAAIRSAGGTPSDALAIINAYREGLEPRPPAWKPGALFHRLTNWRPGQDAHEGWPKPDNGHALACERLKADQLRRDADREAIRLREQRSSNSETRRVERSKVAKLEEAARALPPHELNELIESIDEPFIRNLARRDRFGTVALTAIAASLAGDDMVAADSRGPPSLN